MGRGCCKQTSGLAEDRRKRSPGEGPQEDKDLCKKTAMKQRVWEGCSKQWEELEEEDLILIGPRSWIKYANVPKCGDRKQVFK